MNIFFQIHQDLPREGPGDSLSTQKAIALMKDLPANPRIVDIGCGPGMQTLDLASTIPGAHITAVDTHQPFLDQLQKRVQTQGLSERIYTLNQSMFEMTLPQKSYDALWCEGAIYIMGFENGLKSWRPLLKPGGYLAATEISWLKPNLPQEIFSYWMHEYPGMLSTEENLALLKTAGYRVAGQFTLPPESWWSDYYAPMETRLAGLQQEYRDDPEALACIESTRMEIDMHRKYSEWYGYVFYIGQVV